MRDSNTAGPTLQEQGFAADWWKVGTMLERFRYRGVMTRWSRALKSVDGVGAGVEPRHPVTRVLNLSATRIDEIVAAAERASHEIGAEVERELRPAAGSTSGSAEMIATELGQALVERAQALRTEAQQLAAILSRASGQLEAIVVANGDEVDRSDLNGSSPSTLPLQVVRPPAPHTEIDDDGLRLLATQMAIAGASAEDIERRLRADFDVDDPSSIVASTHAPARVAAV